MKTVLSYKTETTGLIDYSARSSSENQPHLVRLAAVLFNAETQEIIKKIDVIISPNGWDIPDESVKIHDISHEYALAKGISEQMAISMFLALFNKADYVVTSSKQFNARIIRIALTRYTDSISVEKWKIFAESYCAAKMAKDDLGVKKITFYDALFHYTGQQAINTSDSLVNAESAAKVYFAIKAKN